GRLASKHYLHAAGTADGRMRYIAVAADLVGGIDDHHPLAELVRQHPGDLPQAGRLADPGRAEQQQALAAFDLVADLVDGAEHRPADAQRQPDDLALAVADRRDAVQGAPDARPAVAADIA